MAYHRPRQLSEALSLLHSTSAVVLAGGSDLYPAHPGRQLPGDVLDLTAIGALSGISSSDDGWRIGATTTWSTIARADLPPAFQALQQAAREVGAIQIQNSGTIGGNLCNASPAADGVPPLLVLDAEVELASARGDRRLPLAEFITGVRRTALQPGEIVTAVHVPSSAANGVAAFGKLGARAYLVISIAMVAVRLELAQGRIRAARVAVGSCSPVATRLTGFEAALIGGKADQPATWRDALAGDISQRLTPIDDIRADAAYRCEAVEKLVIRALAQAEAA
ncbi:MAG: xanthine dehydrogenase family protein subunit M [Rhodobacteraceae bacterium]|nr:xanthine dehydrogenase family protein subunit M [Paracoccaceae bacterium]